MLQSELHIIEDFIGRYVYGNEGEVATDQARLRELFAETSVDFRARIQRHFFGNHRDQVLTRYIHFHQTGIVKLANDVDIFLGASMLDDRFHESAIQDGLDDLSNYLEITYPDHFDLDNQLSNYAIRHLEQNVAEDTSIFFDRTDNNEVIGLLAAVTISLAQFVEHSGPAGITYRQRSAVFQAMQTVTVVLGQEKENFTEHIFVLLYRQNFNLPAFINWYKELTGKANALPAIERRLQFDKALSILKDTGVYPTTGLDPAFPSIKDELINWLAEQVTDNEKPVVPTDTVPLNCSVSQFALFLRLLYLTGSFPVTNVSELFRFFSRHFTTKKQEHISIKSFRKAFYSSEQSTAAVVLDLIKRMTAQVETLYFPK